MLRNALLSGRPDAFPVRAPDLVSVLRAVRSHATDAGDLQAVHRGAVLAYRRWPTLELDSPARRILIELLLEAGERERAARLFGPRVGRGAGARLVALDLDNPFAGEAQHGDRWARGFAALFTGHGLEAVVVDEAGHDDDRSHAFDRLRCDSHGVSIEDGPLVSVVLAVRDPGPELTTAVDSIIAQTYRHWELLIIDDGSGPSADTTLDSAARRDRRIRLVRHAESTGPYVRRNEALTIVKGEFVTFHDGDDWSHPRRLEHQLRPLLAAEPPIATVCASLRVTDHLQAVHGRGRSLRITESSIMMRREPTTRLIGFFDSVRRAADSGFRLRLETLGAVQLVDPAAPLSLVRFRPSTLSGTDLRDGWTHPARVAYADAHAHWLELEQQQGRLPKVAFRGEQRPFPVHPYIASGRPAQVTADVLVVGDAREGARALMHELLQKVMRSVGDRHATAAFLHAAEPGPGPAASPFSRVVREARAREVLVDVVPGDRVSTPSVAVLSTATALALSAPIETPGAELVLLFDPANAEDTSQLAAAELAMLRAFPAAQPTVRRINLGELADVLAR